MAELQAADGLALAGYRPVVELLMAEFMLVAMNQVVNEAPRQRYMSGGRVKVPLVLKAGYGFTAGWAGQHTGSIYTMFAGIPGLKVVLPSTPADAKGLLAASIRDDDPVMFIEHLALYNTKGEVPDGDYVTEIGKAAITKAGTDITIVSYSRMAAVALDVARRLEEDEGISVEVVDLRSLRPLDRSTILQSVRKTGKAVVLEEDWLSYGVGAEIAATIQEGAFDYLDAPVRRVAAAEIPLPYAKPLELAALPDATALLKVIHETLDATRFRG